MSLPKLKNARANKIVAYLTDAKMQVDSSFARLSIEFDLLSEYPKTPSQDDIKKWNADVKKSCNQLIKRITEFQADAGPGVKSAWPPAEQGGGGG